MKYTKEKLATMSYVEWMKAIAEELNAAGFKTSGYSKENGRFMNNIAPYEVHNANYFFMGAINDPKAMDYLKSIGLVNNGRCPMCGGEIKGLPSTFTCGNNPNLNFQICSSCRKEGERISLNPAQNSGCLLALALIPWHLVKSLF